MPIDFLHLAVITELSSRFRHDNMFHVEHNDDLSSWLDAGRSARATQSLWSLLDFDFFFGGEVDFVDDVVGGDFSDDVDVDVVGAEGEIFSEGDFVFAGIALEWEVLV